MRFGRDGSTIQVETLDELQIRSVEGETLQRIPTTIGATLPGLSPDGRWLITTTHAPTMILQLWRPP